MLQALKARFYTPDVAGLAKDSAWSGAATVLEFGTYTLEMVLLSRYLAPELLGTLFLILSIPELVQHVLDFRVRELMVRYLTVFYESGQHARVMALVKLLWLVDVGVALLALAIVAGIGGWAAETVIGSGQYARLMTLFAVGLLFGSLDSASDAVLRVFGHFDLAFVGSLITKVAGLALVAAAIWTDKGLGGVVTARVIGLALSTLVLGALGLYQLGKHVPLRTVAPLKVLRQDLREIAGFAFQVNITATIRILAAKTDVILVGLLLGPASVAVYKIVTQIAKGISIMSGPLTIAFYPHYARLVIQDKIATMRRLSAGISALMLAAVGLIGLGLYFFGDPLIRLYAGAQYSPHAVLLPAAIIGIAPGIILFWGPPYLLSLGLARARTVGTALGAGLGLASLVLLTQQYDILGAVIGFGLTFSLPYLLIALFILRTARQGPSDPAENGQQPRKRVLIIGPTPPPHFGVSVSTSQILQDRLWTERFQIRHLDTSDRRSTANIGSFDPTNIGLGLLHGLRYLGLILSRRPELVYLPISQGLGGFLRDAQFIVAAHSLRIPVVIHLRGNEFQDFTAAQPKIVQWLVRSSLRRVQRAIVLGDSLRDNFNGFIDPKRIAVVPNGVSAPRRLNALSLKPNEVQGLFLSNLRERKGLLVLVQALKYLLPRHPDLIFTVAGPWRSTAFRSQVERVLVSIPEQDRIRFVGSATGETRDNLYSHSDFFVFPPTQPEGHPRVVLEAMAAGLPVIATPQGAIPETVLDGESGLLVPTGDPAALAQSMERLIGDPDLRTRLGSSGRQRYYECYTAALSNRRLADVFDQVLSENES
jgi:glycosyltransferase involved in cell wall biosynthesis/O-antigen/teichoic acid export membrane protein